MKLSSPGIQSSLPNHTLKKANTLQQRVLNNVDTTSAGAKQDPEAFKLDQKPGTLKMLEECKEKTLEDTGLSTEFYPFHVTMPIGVVIVQSYLQVKEKKRKRHDGKEKMNKAIYANSPFGNMHMTTIVMQFNRDCNRGYTLTSKDLELGSTIKRQCVVFVS
ncbi:hypothetical protein STEG23_034942, partial [Scotinomys teguina]